MRYEKNQAKMKSLILPSFLLLISIALYPQETWITTIETPIFERVVDIREIPNGNYLAVGRRDLSPGPECYTFLVEIATEGEIIKDKKVIIPDSSTSLHQFIEIGDTSFALIGMIRSDADGWNDIWIVHFNYDLEIIRQKKLHGFPTYPFGEFDVKFISNGNLLVNGFIADNDNILNSDIFFYETNANGDSISSALIEMDGMQHAYEFLERKDRLGYYCYAQGNFPVDPNPPGITTQVTYDTNFQYLFADSVPRLITNTMNARWLSSGTYLISGKEYYQNPSYCNMGIVKLDTDDQILNENYFGLMPDTITYVGALDHLDFRNTDTIYFCGIGNVTIDFPYSQEPSWIILNCLDSNLNLRWQTLYGGDAFYFSWEVYATSDGGCIVSASKYDYTLPEYDYDVVLLKYNNEGLLTSLHENEEARNSLLIYPNPGKDKIKVNSDFRDAHFQLFDLAGRCLLTNNLDPGLNIIDVGNFCQGTYIYLITIDNRPVSSSKWIKM